MAWAGQERLDKSKLPGETHTHPLWSIYQNQRQQVVERRGRKEAVAGRKMFLWQLGQYTLPNPPSNHCGSGEKEVTSANNLLSYLLFSWTKRFSSNPLWGPQLSRVPQRDNCRTDAKASSCWANNVWIPSMYSGVLLLWCTLWRVPTICMVKTAP